ncbi:MAG: hypothetical protein C4574_00685 [Candidatus Latescibacterota bacterium]|jgi:microcystin-dependent protein|nr:MAG: hypothetical protein C4574_00685 [Candidatus Latescibacterota bacterium]
MMKFVCPEAEGARIPNDASRLILERLFSSYENANNTVVQTPNGTEELFFSTIKKSGTIEEHLYAKAAVIRYLDFFQFPAVLKTAAEFAVFAGIALTLNFSTSDTFYWKVESISELYGTPFWFTVYTDEGMTLLIPDSTGGTRRGKIDRGQIIGNSRQFKNSALFDGETIPAGSFRNFIARTRVYPSLIEDNLKAMADRKYRSLSDFIIFEAEFPANPGDWVEYATNVFIIVSQRRSNGTYQYTAVRECKTVFAYSGDDIPLSEEFDAINSIMLGGKSSAFLVPSGTILPFGGAAAPTGYLLCNGTSYLRADYTDLFAVIGTSFGAADGTHFNVPDLRGQFLRGKDGGAGVDPNAGTRTALKTGGATGDNVGSYEADAFQGHKHTTPAYFGAASGARDKMYGVTETTLVANVPSSTPVTDGTNGTPRTSSESRPKNVNVNYIIKT